VRGNGFLGYVGEAPRDPDTLIATGDIGAFNDDGTLSLRGRKKSIFVTAFGRNVSPEWVESELCLQPAIAQAAVFGEARPFNVAVIVARTPVSAEVDAAIAAVNRGLPDYARIERWVSAQAPFSLTNGQLTANGRLRREALAAAYADVLNTFYEEVEEVAS
jgi:long-subunit acyl-CoA synthetase (AMP-forming)